MKPCTSSRTLSKSLHLLLLLALLPFISRAQSNDCATAPTLNSYPVTCGGTTGGSLTAGATYTTIGGGTGCSSSTRDDVWYTFIAKSTSPTITITGSTVANSRVQVFGGTCGGTMISLDCGTNSANPTTVINGQYWIRIYSTNNSTGTFNICVTDPAPANNTCTNASTLTSTLNTCSAPGSGNFYAASATATAVAPCTGPVVQDLWYSFVAQTDNATITLNSVGSNVNTPRIQVFSGTCAALTSIACGTSGMAVSSLTEGSTYFVRVYTSAGTAVTTPVNSGFNICVTHTRPVAPINDECSGAITLPVNGSCSNIIMTMVSATASAGGIAAPCTGTLSYDVWFKFTAVNTTTTITTSAFGTGIGTSRGIQVFTGACGGLSNLVCTGPATNPSVVATTVAGTTYYVRIFTTGAGTAPITDGDFKICVFTSGTPPPRFGNSYVNLSKKTVGGVVETGDTLEIRMTINHTSGTLYKPRYVDNIPTNTIMLSGANDSIRIISNEGKTVRRYTPTPSVYNDAATYVPGTLPAGTYNIRMNIGFLNASPGTPADNTDTDVTGATGTIVASTDRPKGGGGVLFATSFRVKVTGNPGDTIKFSTGKFIYRTVSTGGSDIALSTIPYNILISTPMTLCSNSIGLNNAQEFGGSFGDGGTLNRTTDLTNPIPGYTFINVTPSQGVGDGQYAIVKNMSPRNSTNQTANKQPSCGTPPAAQDCNNRMHGGFWDIDGDHTGTNNATGNLPPAASDTAGYMLEVNTDYVAAEVYRQSLTGLCPSTYYEFSAWMRNICTNCGIDTSGTATYQPGVYPNLTFILDGLDRYSTGEVNIGGWIKKGFVFLTGPAQTGVTFSIRNNSQGGGGNDWVMDDISVATCLPNMKYSPSANPTVCVLNASTIYDTVASFFDNYVYYKWQRSTDGGDNYSDITTPQGPVTPTLINGLWQYVTHYVVPPSEATLTNNGDMYRVVAATTISNLGGTNCIVTSGINFLTLNVLNCGTPLKTDVLSFNGKLVGDMANLSWITSKEDEPVKYKIERSTDGTTFTTVGTINGYNNVNSNTNQYSFIDPTPVTGHVYYRLGLVTQAGSTKYSRIIPLSIEEGKKFALVNVINPFSQVLDFDISSPVDAKIEAELLDIFGKLVKKKSFVIHNGVSQLSLTDTEVLAAGTYILRIRNNEQILTRKVLKRAL